MRVPSYVHWPRSTIPVDVWILLHEVDQRLERNLGLRYFASAPIPNTTHCGQITPAEVGEVVQNFRLRGLTPEKVNMSVAGPLKQSKG